MDKNNRYLFVTIIFYFLFCSMDSMSNTLDDPIGLEKWLVLHVNQEVIDKYNEQTNKKMDNLKNALFQEGDIGYYIGIVDCHLTLLKEDRSTCSKLSKVSDIIPYKSEGMPDSSESVPVHWAVIDFERFIYPYLINKSEEEISDLRFQWVCENYAHLLTALKKYKQQQGDR